jgi:DNA adenine methylase
MDPPYSPASETANFTAYTAGGFGPAEQERLRDVARKLIDRGVHVLLSNSDTPFVRKLYKGFKIEEVQAPRRVNSKGDKRGNVGELLISGRTK